MTDNDNIRIFVRNTLGCSCPEEVFRTIQCVPGVRLRDDITLDAALLIGNRLLVYVFEPTNSSDIQQHLAFLVTSGKKERDTRGLNRFRLVIVTDEGEDPQLLKNTFDTLADKDEKVHLHMISKKKNIFSENVGGQWPFSLQ